MAALTPISQEFFDLNDRARGIVIGVHTLKLKSASGDTFTVPTLADTTSGVSVKQLERANDPTVTVTSSNFTVTLGSGGAIGDEIVVVSLHQGRLNSNEEV